LYALVAASHQCVQPVTLETILFPFPLTAFEKQSDACRTDPQYCICTPAGEEIGYFDLALASDTPCGGEKQRPKKNFFEEASEAVVVNFLPISFLPSFFCIAGACYADAHCAECTNTCVNATLPCGYPTLNATVYRYPTLVNPSISF
jgi:hypothetical protein